MEQELLAAISKMMDEKLAAERELTSKMMDEKFKVELEPVKADMKELKKKVSDLELHLENVTDRNIRIAAEGHLNLNRKLDEALKIENEKELLMIRLHFLEDEVRKIKERLKEIA